LYILSGFLKIRIIENNIQKRTNQINPRINPNLPGIKKSFIFVKKIDSLIKIRKGIPKKNRGDLIPFTIKYNSNKIGKTSLKIAIIFLIIKSVWHVQPFI
jgi:hypothetical protein